MWNFWTHFPISLTLCPRLQILSPSNPQNLSSGKFQYKSSLYLCNKIEGPFHGNACLCSFSLVAKWVAFLSGGTSHIRELVGKRKVLGADMYAWLLEPHHWRLHLGWALLLIWWTTMTTLPSTPPLSPSDIASQIGQTNSIPRLQLPSPSLPARSKNLRPNPSKPNCPWSSLSQHLVSVNNRTFHTDAKT